jgi:hypothetical protein
MKTPQSELPWKVDKDHIEDSQGRYVAICVNAAFIVKACNNHENLIGTLKSIAERKWVSEFTDVGMLRRWINEFTSRAEQAIQSAVGKEE